MEVQKSPLVRLPVAAKGFLCGSILAGSFALPYGIVVLVLLMAFCIFMFMESVFAFGRSRNTLSFSASLVAGIIVSATMALFGLATAYVALALFVAAVIYAVEFVGYRKAHHPA
jgi:hypothetical protein